MYERVCDIDFTVYQPKRAGVVPAVKIKDQTWYCFGVDGEWGELTDFGGTVNYRMDKSAINGALREFKEESLKTFRKIYYNELGESVIARADSCMILIHYFKNMDMMEKLVQFRKKVGTIEKPEVKDLVWLNHDELRKIVLHSVEKITPSYGFPPGFAPSFTMYEKTRECLKMLFV